MTTHTCLSIPEAMASLGGIKLEQTGFDQFTVTYGKQVTKGLCYAQACTELGAAIMHWLACDSCLANQTAKEAKADGWTWKSYTEQLSTTKLA